MATERKVLLIGRHGQAPQKPEGGSIDTLVPEAVQELYKRGHTEGRAMVAEYEATLDRIFLDHTDAQRTRYTGLAFLIGAFDLKPLTGSKTPPQSVDDLADYVVDVNIGVNEALSIRRPNVNQAVVKDPRDYSPAIDYWLQHPKATEHEGEPIKSYATLLPRCVEGIKVPIHKLVNNPLRYIGVVVTHATIIEPVVLALIESGRSLPRIERTADIGGGFDMGEFAALTLDKTHSGVYTASLNVKGVSYAVDVSQL